MCCGGMMQSPVARSLLAEFLCETVAMFFFTIVAGLSYGAGFDAAVAVGLAVIVLHQSEKAHLNPVVSIAVALCDIDFGWVNLFLRILAQVLGAILGGLLAIDGWKNMRLEFGHNPATSTGYRCLIFEFVFTALLVLVFLRSRGKTVLAPVVHGLTYLVAYAVSSSLLGAGRLFLQGTALLNPALAIGLIIGSESHDTATDEGDIWLFIVGPFIGALLGVVFYQLTSCLDDEWEEETVQTTEEVIRTTVIENQPVAKPVDQGYGGNTGGYGGQGNQPDLAEGQYAI